MENSDRQEGVRVNNPETRTDTSRYLDKNAELGQTSRCLGKQRKISDRHKQVFGSTTQKIGQTLQVYINKLAENRTDKRLDKHEETWTNKHLDKHKGT
jgi:hypothetical protein